MMRRRSFLRFLGLAPVAGVASAAGAGEARADVFAHVHHVEFRPTSHGMLLKCHHKGGSFQFELTCDSLERMEHAKVHPTYMSIDARGADMDAVARIERQLAMRKLKGWVSYLHGKGGHRFTFNT